MSEWTVGETPWIRTENVGRDGWTEPGFAQCYFCGEHSVILSHGDVKTDTGRVQAYCKNTSCDVREVEVVLARDGMYSDTRADVRALRALNEGQASMEREMPTAVSLQEFLDVDEDAEDAAILERRMARGPVVAMDSGSAS